MRGGERGGEEEGGEGGGTLRVGLTWGALQRCPHGFGAALAAHLHCELQLDKEGWVGMGGLRPKKPLPGVLPPPPILDAHLWGSAPPEFPFGNPTALRAPRVHSFPPPPQMLFNGTLPPRNAISQPLRPTKSHLRIPKPSKRPLMRPHDPKAPTQKDLCPPSWH